MAPTVCVWIFIQIYFLTSLFFLMFQMKKKKNLQVWDKEYGKFCLPTLSQDQKQLP